MDVPGKNSDIKLIAEWLKTGSINIFGMPFAGKDTQAKLLAHALKGCVIAGGDILRSHPNQEKIVQLMATGELVPTDFYLEVILPYMSRDEFNDKPLILSSVGRWKGEEKAVIDAAREAGHPIKAAVFLNLHKTEVWRRFEASLSQKDRGHRHDDAAHIVEVRLKEFREKTYPVIDYYRSEGLLIELDGHGNPETVHKHIIDHLMQHSVRTSRAST